MGAKRETGRSAPSDGFAGKSAFLSGFRGRVGSSIRDALGFTGATVSGVPRDKRIIQLEPSSLSPRADFDVPSRLAKEPAHDKIFIHAAWSGSNHLTDGSLDVQLRNAEKTAELVQFAHELGCTKFVNLASMEELFLQDFLARETDTQYPLRGVRTNYAIAKISARHFGQLICQDLGITFLNIFLSAPVNPTLEGQSFIESNLRRIQLGRLPETPTSNLQIDLTGMFDVALAVVRLGFTGASGHFYAGSGRFSPLQGHFDYMSCRVRNAKSQCKQDFTSFDGLALKGHESPINASEEGDLRSLHDVLSVDVQS